MKQKSKTTRQLLPNYRNCNLEIRDIPDVENENIFHLTSNINMKTLVGEDVTTDVSACYRITKKVPAKTNLVVQSQN